MSSRKLCGAERDRRMAALAAQVSTCPRCAILVGSRIQPVFGTGSHAAEIMLIGEAPGRNEDLQGEPFVGAAGRVLNQILAGLGVSRAGILVTNRVESREGRSEKREGAWIANAVKCRPPKNRKPTPEEIANCRPYLETEIELIEPRCIATLGATASESLLGLKSALGKIRGTIREYRGIPVVCTYHPAYVFRNRAAEAVLAADLALVLAASRRS